MNPSLSPLDLQLITVVLAILAIGLPIVFALAIRFLWERKLSLGRSKELEKLIWQLHRIASAMEHQMNLSFPAVQPGTEEARDLAYVQPLNAQPAVAAPVVAAPRIAAEPAAIPQPAAQVQQPVVQPVVQPVAQPAAQPMAPQPAAAAQTPGPAPAAQKVPVPALEPREPGAEAPRGGVNSMFGF